MSYVIRVEQIVSTFTGDKFRVASLKSLLAKSINSIGENSPGKDNHTWYASKWIDEDLTHISDQSTDTGVMIGTR